MEQGDARSTGRAYENVDLYCFTEFRSDTYCSSPACSARAPPNRKHHEEVHYYLPQRRPSIFQAPAVGRSGATGLFLIVQPSGVKSWAWRGRISGEPRKLTLGRYPAHSLADAHEWASALTRQRDGGIDPLAERERKAKVDAAAAHLATFTVDVAFNAYMDGEGASRKSAGEKRRLYDACFKPALGSMSLHAVDRSAVEAVIAAKHKTHPTSANRLVSLAKRFFRWCVTKGHHQTRLTVDPTANITKPADEVKRDRVLSDYEVKLFLMALREEGQASALPMKLLLLTGARRSEVFEASWTEFDMATGDWLLPSNRSKNKLPHLLPLPEAATALIASIPNCERSPLLFASQRTATKAVSGISKMVARIRERMEKRAAQDGRQIDHWQIHDLRRTVATGMAALMVHPHEIEGVLNHVSGTRNGVAGIYNRHAYYEEKQRALEVWSKKISDIEKQIAG